MEHKYHNGKKLDKNVKAWIKQPDGVNYLIQSYHYSLYYAQEYKDMMIEKMKNYIILKRQGRHVAPLMTLERMEKQLEVMEKWEVMEI